jgi:hypothetical protein
LTNAESERSKSLRSTGVKLLRHDVVNAMTTRIVIYKSFLMSKFKNPRKDTKKRMIYEETEIKKGYTCHFVQVQPF